MSKNTRTRILLTAVAALLLVVVAVGGTMAWLADTTTEVTNTFSPAGIDINLDETWNDSEDVDKDGITEEWIMQMIPGTSKAKDPIVSVEKTTTVDIYLFVKFNETVDENYLTYTNALTAADSGWTELETGVWYRPVTAAEIAAGTECEGCRDNGILHWHLLVGDIVSVADTVGANTDNITGGEMTWTAYAIQQMGSNNTVMEPAAAWAALKTQEGIQ